MALVPWAPDCTSPQVRGSSGARRTNGQTPWRGWIAARRRGDGGVRGEEHSPGPCFVECVGDSLEDVRSGGRTAGTERHGDRWRSVVEESFDLLGQTASIRTAPRREADQTVVARPVGGRRHVVRRDQREVVIRREPGVDNIPSTVCGETETPTEADEGAAARQRVDQPGPAQSPHGPVHGATEIRHSRRWARGRRDEHREEITDDPWNPPTLTRHRPNQRRCRVRHEQISIGQFGVDRREQRLEMGHRELPEVETQRDGTTHLHAPPPEERAMLVELDRREVGAAVHAAERLGGEHRMKLPRHDERHVVPAPREL